MIDRRDSIAGTRARGSIPIYCPDLSGNEKKYVMECLDSTWISSNGRFIGEFEDRFRQVTGARHAVAVCNGTVALHLALHCLGVGPGDEVIVPTFTYIASVNAIAQTGAKPIFVESNAGDWLLDPQDVERHITTRTRAIMPVHLYGVPSNMEILLDLAKIHGLKVIEDCAEAFGTTFGGRHVGLFGDVGAFSFYGNKTITTGEGGIVVTNDDALAARLRIVKGQGQSLSKRYWHEVLGFNYRMTNIAAAIGLAQIERFDSFLRRKREIATLYQQLSVSLPVKYQQIAPTAESSYWLVTLALPRGTNRELLMQDMEADGVETRPVFYCAHTMPMYESDEEFPIACDIAARGISLPSYPSMSDEDVVHVVRSLANALQGQGVHAIMAEFPYEAT